MSDKVAAGKLRRWLLFETLIAENDSDGKLVETWVPAFDTGNPMPAEVTPFSGVEFIASNAKQTRITHRLKVRFRPGFEEGAKMRASERGIVYNIEAVLPDRDSGIRYITFMASSGVSLAGN
jgi:SPP1 family predicted phage head-tail adaptor